MDDSFDRAFETMGLPWLPWVGIGYREAETKTLILGESIYAYGDGGETVRNRILEKQSLRQRHMAHGILANPKFKSAYLRNFERAVFLKKKPTGAQQKLLWSQVIFHNLVPRLLHSRRQRPTDEDYTNGWKIFLELAKVVQPQRCLVYGLESKKIDALMRLLDSPDTSHKIAQKKQRHAAISGNRPITLSILINGRRLDVLCMRHPSSFFSWDKWGLFLRETDMMPVVLS